MLKEFINWEAIKGLEETNTKLENIFIDSEILAKFQNEKEIGVIHKLKNEKIVMVFSKNKSITDSDILAIVNNSKIFDLLSEGMNYLRNVRFDHAINYEIRNLTEPLLGELYKNKKVEIKDILGVNE